MKLSYSILTHNETDSLSKLIDFLVTQKDLLKTYAKGSTEYEAQVIRIQELEKGLAALTNANKDFLNAGTLTDKLQKKFDSTIKNSKKSVLFAPRSVLFALTFFFLGAFFCVFLWFRFIKKISYI